MHDLTLLHEELASIVLVGRDLTAVLSKPEIIRCLKRYVAREIYQNLPSRISTDPSRGPLARP